MISLAGNTGWVYTSSMSAELLQQPLHKTYWLAGKPWPGAEPHVVGPYTEAEATEIRRAWIEAYQSSKLISRVFIARDREQAEKLAVDVSGLFGEA